MPASTSGRMLTFSLAVAPIALAAFFLIDAYLQQPWMRTVTFTALFVYLIVYMAKSLRAISGRNQPLALLAGIVLAVGLNWVTDKLYVDPGIWSVQETDADADNTQDVAESLLFSQSQRIDEAVAKIAPSDKSTPSAFFIGFAGYAEEQVFAEEIKLAARTLGERYGSNGRSLMLVNDRRDLNAQPLANPTALKYALRAVAAKMNLDKDILFLSLSSHGSEDGALSVSNGSLMLHDLTANDLAQALDDAGIKSRVIVVSACYSGAFIEPLRTPDTIVLTASAEDRTSFGCSDTRELTYFGEAFYRDALPHTTSLREAFERSRAEIEKREKAEDVEASKPQAFFGEQIERKLSALEPQQPAPPLTKTPPRNRQPSA